MRPALPTLLSQALIAYTIEFDDEAEKRIPHGTTVGGLAGMRAGGVWLTSQVMWTNFIRHINSQGRPVREVQALACLSEKAIKSRLHHLEWWAYVIFAPDPKDARAKPRYGDLLVKLTPNGEKAAEGWALISREIDDRWSKRFGKTNIEKLMKALRVVAAARATDLPDYLPVVDYSDGMTTTLVMPDQPVSRTPAAKLDLSSLISRALLAFTLEFERTSDVSLTAAANVLRVVGESGTPLKEVPLRAGVSKEGVVALVNFLKKNGFVSESADKAKTVKLTAKGKKSRDHYLRSLATIEKSWEKAFGKQTLESIRGTLNGVIANRKLVEGLKPHDGSWRLNKRYIAQTNAVLADPHAALPHHPMITHRGGFPDGT